MGRGVCMSLNKKYGDTPDILYMILWLYIVVEDMFQMSEMSSWISWGQYELRGKIGYAHRNKCWSLKIIPITFIDIQTPRILLSISWNDCLNLFDIIFSDIQRRWCMSSKENIETPPASLMWSYDDIYVEYTCFSYQRHHSAFSWG